MNQSLNLVMAAAVLAAGALAHFDATAQAADGPAAAASQTAPVEHAPLVRDLKDFATWPADWKARDWLKFTGVVAAVSAAYRQDDEIRDRYKNDGERNYNDVLDAMPTAVTFGGMWLAGKVARNEEARWEADAMRRAFVIQTISTEVLKVAFRRERPGPGVPKDNWNDHGLSFPSGHTAAAFAIGTVLAESGNDKRRALRRTVGYGLGVVMGYQRVNHDAHWFSDTVAGAAIGIATAKFVLRRREGTEPRGQVLVLPADGGGAMLTYSVPLR